MSVWCIWFEPCSYNQIINHYKVLYPPHKLIQPVRHGSSFHFFCLAVQIHVRMVSFPELIRIPHRQYYN